MLDGERHHHRCVARKESTRWPRGSDQTALVRIQFCFPLDTMSAFLIGYSEKLVRGMWIFCFSGYYPYHFSLLKKHMLTSCHHCKGSVCESVEFMDSWAGRGLEGLHSVLRLFRKGTARIYTLHSMMVSLGVNVGGISLSVCLHFSTVIFLPSQLAIFFTYIHQLEMWIRSLDWEDLLLEEGMATHSSILAWRIPWTEEPGGLQSIGLHRVGTQLKQLGIHAHINSVTTRNNKQ